MAWNAMRLNYNGGNTNLTTLDNNCSVHTPNTSKIGILIIIVFLIFIFVAINK